MFGYAVDETRELMPMPIMLAHRLVKRQAEVRKQGELAWLRPDAKSQVTVEYGPDGRPARIDAVVLSTQHAPEVKHKQLEEAVIEQIIKPVLPAELLDAKTKFWVNPTGRFVVGGPYGDCGLTGRKIIVDTLRRHGSPRRRRLQRQGSDQGRPQRLLLRALRGQEHRRGQARAPLRGAGRLRDRRGQAGGRVRDDLRHRRRSRTRRSPSMVERLFDFRPAALIETLELRRPIYAATAAYGHFGRTEKGFTWERTRPRRGAGRRPAAQETRRQARQRPGYQGR